MANRRYQKGYRKENKVVNQHKDKDFIAFRSAGSHSPIDVVAIDTEHKIIKLIQCKSDNMPKSEKSRLERTNEALNGMFKVTFEVI